MNSLALIALLALNGQETPFPQHTAPQTANAARNQYSVAVPPVRDILEEALDHAEDATLEAEKQTRCVQDKPTQKDGPKMECAPKLAATQATEALADTRKASAIMAQTTPNEKDRAAIARLLARLDSAASELELRARKLANTAPGNDEYAQEAYQAGNSAKETAIRLQTLLDDMTLLLSTGESQDKN